MDIQPLIQPTFAELQPLIDASRAEGYEFVQRLWDEYQAGENRFDGKGALLLGVYAEGRLIAVGGVQPDPYLGDPAVGRIRHVYVLPDQRRGGVGRLLVQALMARSASAFSMFTLRTPTEHGRAFYESLGFSSTPRFDAATHWRVGQSDSTDTPL